MEDEDAVFQLAAALDRQSHDLGDIHVPPGYVRSEEDVRKRT
jgi:hypothetical protein